VERQSQDLQCEEPFRATMTDLAKAAEALRCFVLNESIMKEDEDLTLISEDIGKD